MPDTPKQPVTVGDLLTIGVDRIRRPATVADLVSALRAEGVLVVEKVDGGWPEWALDARQSPLIAEALKAAGLRVAFLDALAEAQPIPLAGE